MKVFISGSKETVRYYRVRMPYPIREKLDEFMEDDTEIIIGDCMGIDADVQRYLNDNGYRNVTVYVAGRNRPARNNEGKWEEKHFDASYFNGYSMRVEKDIHLAEDADVGFAVWNEESKGTFVNLVCLLAQGKPCEVFSLKQQKWLDIKSVSDLEAYVSPKDEQQGEFVAGILDTCGFSDEMINYQISKDCVSDRDLITIICRAPIPLTKKEELLSVLGKRIDLKREILDAVRLVELNKSDWNKGDWKFLKKEIRLRFNGKCSYSAWSEYQAAWKGLHDALNEIGSDPVGHSVYYLFSEWYDTDVFLEKSYGAGMFMDRESAEAYMLAEELADEDDTDEINEGTDVVGVVSDDEERSGEGWYRLECWDLLDPECKNPRYDYYYYNGEICWFEKLIPEKQEYGNIYHMPEERRFTSGRLDLNLMTPYQPGDIVNIDCRPFGPPLHAMILEARDQFDCCFPRIIFRIPYTDQWTEQALKHRMLYKDAELSHYTPMLSPLYRIRKVRDDEMTSDDEKLRRLSEAIGGDEEKAIAVFRAWSDGTGNGMSFEEAVDAFHRAGVMA